jgi:hypothetical protein
MSPDQRARMRERWQALTPEQRRTLRERWPTMTPDERRQYREHFAPGGERAEPRDGVERPPHPRRERAVRGERGRD